MANVRRRILFGVTVAITGALMFIVASAYLVARGWPTWLAGAIGAAAFPVLPVAWHVVGERRRTARRAAAKVPPKSSLTGAERFQLRLVAVVVLVIGPMVAVGRLDVVRAAWHHGLWFVPTPSDAEREARLLARVPADAELVIVARQPSEANQRAVRGVVAWGGGQLLAAIDGGDFDEDGVPRGKKIDELNAERGKLKWLPIAAVALVPTSDESVVIASDGWRSKVEPPGTGPSTEILRELARAPDGAPFVAAFVPRTTRDVLSIRGGAAWATVDGKTLVVEGRVEVRDLLAGAKLVELANAALHGKTSDVPERCREAVAKLVDHVQISQIGVMVTARADVPASELFALMMCAVD